MMFMIVLSIIFPLCLVIILIGCLDCLFKKKRIETFRNRDTTYAQHNTALSVDICDISSTSEQVTIEPLPDILSKVSTAPVLRPRITCSNSVKQESSAFPSGMQKSFPRDHLTYLNEIGSGWFGKAIESEAVQIVGGSHTTRVVVKILKDDASKVEQKQFLDEVSAFRYLDQANLMSLLGQCTETTPFLVILEYAAHGNLKSYLIHHSQELDDLVAKNRLSSFALDAASGLACLHRNDYIHNDLAARTCLVMSDYTLKIGDYGISDYLFKNEYYNTGSELLPIRWMAPEILVQTEGVWTARSSSKSSDMWSFGILLWEIFTVGDRPYNMLTDDAVLQEVILDKHILPSHLELKIPFKDDIWTIMTQCWQDPSQRLDADQALSSLEQLNRIRFDTIDTMSEFDQKWNNLKQNQVELSSKGSDLGSRIALAGSFVLESLDGDAEAPDGAVTDDITIDIVDEDSQRSHDIAQSAPKIVLQATIEEPDQSRIHQDDFLHVPQDQVTVENEIVKTSAPSVYQTPKEPANQHLMITSTPDFQSLSSEVSQYFSPYSSIASEYVSASETFAPSSIQVEEIKESSNKHEVSTGEDFKESLNKTPQINNNNVESVFESQKKIQTEDEDFSEFVRTSPTAPHVEFTDFASAGSDSFGKIQLVLNEDLIIEKDASPEDIGVELPTDVVAEDSSFSEFAASANDKTAADDDTDAFADFVTSALPDQEASTNQKEMELDIQALSSADGNMDLLSWDVSSNTLTNLQSPGTTVLPLEPEDDGKDKHVSTAVSDSDGGLPIKQVPPESLSVFPSLTSDFSLLNHLEENVTEASQATQLEDFSIVQEHPKNADSLNLIQDHTSDVPTLHEDNIDFLLSFNDESQEFSSFDILEQAFSSNPVQPTDSAFVKDDDQDKKSGIHDEKLNGATDLSLITETDFAPAGTKPEIHENRESSEAAEITHSHEFKAAGDILDLDLTQSGNSNTLLIQNPEPQVDGVVSTAEDPHTG